MSSRVGRSYDFLRSNETWLRITSYYYQIWSRFTALLRRELLPIPLQPLLQIGARLLQFVLIDQAAPQRLEIGTRADVEGQFIVGLIGRTLSGGDKQLFVKRGQPALDSTQAQVAFARDGPIRQPQREVIERFGLEVGQQRLRERVFEIRIDHVRAVFQHGRDEAEEPAFGIIFIN